MILNYTNNDDDLKFICYYLNKDTKFILSETLSLKIDNEEIIELEKIIERFFILNNEICTNQKIVNFKKARIIPQIIKIDMCLILLINYINLIKDAIVNGTLKNKNFIDEITSKLNLKFDPDFYLLKIKSGLIENIKPLEGMNKLYGETVVADKNYFICSGLRNYYKEYELVNKKFLFLLNIKNVKFQKYESEGMICCGKKEEEIEVIEVKCEKDKKISLEGQLDIFENIEYKKIDFSKKKYQIAFKKFSIVNNYLCFNNIKVLCDKNYIILKMNNGIIS